MSQRQAVTRTIATREHAYTLRVTNIATDWTENRSVPNKARKWVLAALEDTGRYEA